MNIRDPKTQQRILFFIILIVVVILYFRLSYTPNKNKIARLGSVKDSLQIELQKTEAAKARLPELQAKIARLELAWIKAQQMLPKDKEIPSLIQQISTSGTKAGVSFALFKPSGPIDRKDYAEIPVQIKISSNYHQLGRFLSNVGNLSRIVNVPSIKINTKTGDRSVDAELSTITYTVSREGKEVPRGAPARR